MAKSKGGQRKKTAAKKKPQKLRFIDRLKRIPWYGWIIIAVVLVFSALQIYKYAATKHDIALLDKAEAKMRQIEFPAGGTKTFSRSCSIKSVKYGSPGRPVCGTTVTVVYPKSTTISNRNTESFKVAAKNEGFKLSAYRNESDKVYYNMQDLDDDLDCYAGDVLSTNYAVNSEEQNIFITCQKKFWKQLYPVQ